MIQRMRAAGRYDTTAALLGDALPPESDLANWVKDALTHYWGGPKLTRNPLMRLQVAQQMLTAHDGNAANALRALLRRAVDQVKPEGDRRFTTEWILYNILEMKFIEGRRVREVAGRLAMSEADLYRKAASGGGGGGEGHPEHGIRIEVGKADYNGQPQAKSWRSDAGDR